MYKQFTPEQENIYEFRSHKNYKLDQSSLTRYQFISASADNSTSASYYEFARINFYLSGSDVSNVNPKFNAYKTVGNKFNNYKMHFNKFFLTGSMVFIPQSDFGDEIKRGSFSLTDNSTAATIKIVDDSDGNLYSPNATVSSSNNSPSSSENYVGNIFYDIGTFTITETGSFNGSVNYVDVTSGNYTVSYKGTRDITTYEWTCDALPNEMNFTDNVTIFKPSSSGRLNDNLTSSIFPNYITEVGLYDDDFQLLAVGKLAKPLQSSTTTDTTILVNIDR